MRRNTGREPQGITLAEAISMIAILVGFVALVVWSSLPTLCVDRMSPVKAACIGNLLNIGTGLSMYQADYSDFPAQLTNSQRLGFLREHYVRDDSRFDCPSSDSKPTYSSSRAAFLAWEIGRAHV